MRFGPIRLALIAALLIPATVASADDLYRRGGWAALSSDLRAAAAGDTITVVVYEAAEASNIAQNASRKSSELTGSIGAGSLGEAGNVQLGSGYTGRGEVRRSERLVAQLSVSIQDVLPNGDFVIVGRQRVNVNGENRDIAIRGRIRQADITSDNRVLSTRIANAEIDYDGKGFVSRSARPGLISRLFSLFGLL